jgi:ATP-dependent DNA helicase DinG
VIFDEAHQLPDTATLFFSESISTTQMIGLARDVRQESAASAKDHAALPEAAQALDKAARDLRLAFRQENGRFTTQVIENNKEFVPALDGVVQALDRLADTLKTQAERGEGRSAAGSAR